MNNLNSSNLCVNYAYEIWKEKLDKKKCNSTSWFLSAINQELITLTMKFSFIHKIKNLKFADAMIIFPLNSKATCNTHN